jgi:hypothetical protein
MANTVTALSYANTFGEWVIATNALITENNTFANTIYTKPRGTLYLQDPTLGVQVTANGIIGGQLLVQGTGSGAYVQNTLRVDGQATFANTTTSLTANGLVNLVGANTALNIANNANISGILTLTSTARLNANAATIYANNLLVTNSFTVGGSAMSTLAYTQAAFDKANTATNTATNTQAAFDKANSANVLAQTAFNAANTVATNLSANVTFSAAIDAAQNATIQIVYNTANIGSSFIASGGNVGGTILPSANVTYNLGSSSNVWSNVHVRNVVQYSAPNEVPAANISQILVVSDDGRTVRKANTSAISGALNVSAIPTMNVFSTAGSYTWTIPAGVTSVKVTVIGGGGAGGGYGSVGNNGGTSSISSGTQTISAVSATGGSAGQAAALYPLFSYPGSGGSGSGGDLNIGGGSGYIGAVAYTGSCCGYYYAMGGSGGSSILGGGGQGPIGITSMSSGNIGRSYGAGGSGSTTVNYSAPGGGSGGAAIKKLTGLTPGNTISVTVGSGGPGAGTTYIGGPGAAGVVIFEY